MDIDFELCSETEPEKISSLKGRIAETKLDGRRIALVKEGENISLWGREPVRSANFPEIIEAAKKIPGDFMLDGELCVVDSETGKTTLGDINSRSHLKDQFKIKLMQRMKPATFIAFDILKFNGQELRNVELQKRKEILSQNFTQLPSNFQVSKVWDDIEAAWKDANDKKLEGIVIKDPKSKYIGKRNGDWTKVKRKESFILSFTKYECSPVGITLSNEQGFRVACNGEQHKKVKILMDQYGQVTVEVKGMADRTPNGMIREITFRRLLKNDKS